MTELARIYSLHPISMSTRSVWPMMENLMLPVPGDTAGPARVNRERLRHLSTAISYAQLLERDSIPAPSWSQGSLLRTAIEALLDTPPGGSAYQEQDKPLVGDALAAAEAGSGNSLFGAFIRALRTSPIEDKDLVRHLMVLATELESSYGRITKHMTDDDAFQVWATFSDIFVVRDDIGRARSNLFGYLLWTKLGVCSSARWSLPPPWAPELSSRLLDMGVISLGDRPRVPPPDAPAAGRVCALLYASTSLALRTVAEQAALSPYAVWQFATSRWDG